MMKNKKYESVSFLDYLFEKAARGAEIQRPTNEEVDALRRRKMPRSGGCSPEKTLQFLQAAVRLWADEPKLNIRMSPNDHKSPPKLRLVKPPD
jgi:hypothetical protein